VQNPHKLPADMLAFAEYLNKAGELIAGPDIADIRGGTKALREGATRRQPSVHAVEESTFEGMRFRIYRPFEKSAGRAALFLHGGAWSHLDIDVYDPIARRIALEGDLTVIALDYPLVPETPFPANIEACAHFACYLHSNAAVLGIDPRFALMGDSAGANLALSASLLLRDTGELFIDALGLIYGAYELAAESESYTHYGGGELPMTTEGVRGALAFYIPDEAQRRHPLASPLRSDLSGLPPTFLSVASHDNLYDENIEMARRLGYAGVDVTLRIYPKTIHGFLEAESVTGAAVAGKAMREIARFIASPASG
jgi:acetyl esterase